MVAAARAIAIGLPNTSHKSPHAGQQKQTSLSILRLAGKGNGWDEPSSSRNKGKMLAYDGFRSNGFGSPGRFFVFLKISSFLMSDVRGDPTSSSAALHTGGIVRSFSQ